jgi:hypothetical protein
LNVKAGPLSRWQAAGLHFLICLAIAAVTVTLMLAVWYPRPLFEAAGGNDLLFILLSVDVVLGPLLTLVVFKAGKRGMKFDLWVIGLVQLAALAYGVHVVYLARPVFIVFIKDRYELATAVDLPADKLAEARYPEFRSLPLTGPVLAAADVPTDPAERQKAIEAAFAGLDLHHFPKYYVPYAERRAQVLAAAMTMERFRVAEPASARETDAWLASSGTPATSVRALLLRTRFAWIVVLVDPVTAQPVKMLVGEKIT